MKLISISGKHGNGKYAIVDDENYDWLNQYNWNIQHNYVVTTKQVNHKRITIYMHKLILGLQKEENLVGDHIDGNPLNNQKCNLRIATKYQNSLNTKSRVNSSSSFLGVTKREKRKKWESSIKVNGVNIYLGHYTKEEDAALAYNNAALKYFGNFARLNIIK